MSKRFFESDDDYRARIAREADEAVVEKVTGHAPTQSWLESDPQYRGRVNRDADEHTIKRTTGDAPSPGFFEDEASYLIRVDREAKERTIEDATGQKPRQGFFETDANFHARLGPEADARTIEQLQGQAPKQRFFEGYDEFRRRMQQEADEAQIAQRERDRRERGYSPPSDMNPLVMLAIVIGVIVGIIYVVLVALALTLLLAPVWLGATASGILAGFFLAGPVHARLAAAAAARPTRLSVGKEPPPLLPPAELQRSEAVRAHPEGLIILATTLVFSGALALWPAMAADNVTRSFLAVAAMAGAILGTTFGRRVLWWRVQNRVCAAAGAPPPRPIAPGLALGFSIPAVLLLALLWVGGLSAASGPLDIARQMGWKDNRAVAGRAAAPAESAYVPQPGGPSDDRDGDERGPTRPPASAPTPERSPETAFSPRAAGPLGSFAPPPRVEAEPRESAEGVRDFIREKLQIEQSHNLDRILDQYGPRVVYWDNGSVDRTFIRNDKATYFARWPLTGEELTSPIDVRAEGANWIANFRTNFRVENPAKGSAIEGTQESVCTVRFVDGGFQVLEENGKVLSRRKLQSTPDTASAGPAAPERMPGEIFPETRLRFLADAEAGNLSLDRLRYAINEMYARHGADFPKPELKQQFQRLSWYHPRPHVDLDRIESEFSELERTNLKLLGSVRDAKAAGRPVAAGGAAPPPKPAPAPAKISRIVTIPDLKKMAGTRPGATGLRGEFVLLRREGNKVLLQSRMEMRKYGIEITTDDKVAVFRGQTYVTATCDHDLSPYLDGTLVNIPAEAPLTIQSVKKDAQGRIFVEATF